MSVKTLFLVGPPKTGTTTLAEAIGRIDGCYLPIEKELFHMSGQLGRVTAGPSLQEYKQKRRVEALARHFDRAKTNTQLLIDASTDNYYYCEQFLSSLNQENIDRYYVVVLARLPSEAMKSRYIHNRMRGWEKLGFVEALSMSETRMAEGWSFEFDYIGQFSYVNRIVRLNSQVPKLLVINSRVFFENQTSTIKQVLDFCGVLLREDYSSLMNTVDPSILAAGKLTQIPGMSLFLDFVRRSIGDSAFDQVRALYRKYALQQKSMKILKQQLSAEIRAVLPTEVTAALDIEYKSFVDYVLSEKIGYGFEQKI